MNLSISNFNFMFRTLFVFVVLFGGYNFFIIAVNPKVVQFQNQWQQNYSIAQDFIYSSHVDNLIVGSSMAARMKNDFLPKSFYNLSFSGGSVLTGLEVIKRSGFIPQNIYIENNVIFLEKDQKMIKDLYHTMWWRIKEYLPALQEKNQPLNLLLSKLKTSFGKSHEEYLKDKRDESIYKMSLKRQQQDYSKKLESYKSELASLKLFIEYFEDKGANVIFFEVPIDKSLVFSLKANQQREIIKQYFNNQWLDSSDNNKYKTTDGIHLTYKSAYEYSKEFIYEVKNIK